MVCEFLFVLVCHLNKGTTLQRFHKVDEGDAHGRFQKLHETTGKKCSLFFPCDF